MSEGTFVFTDKAKRQIITGIIVGVLLLAFGAFGLSQGWFDPAAHDAGHHASTEQATLLADAGEGGHGESAETSHGEGHGSEEAHGEGHGHYSWFTRIVANLWLNNVYFTGMSIIGVFFLAINYVTWAGWSAYIKRVFLSFGYFLPVAGILMLIVFLIGNHNLFHWTHEGLNDPIIEGKKGFLNVPFYIIRLVLYFALWYFMFWLIKTESAKEDINGGVKHHENMMRYSAMFLVIFAVTSSTSAWDWIMSIDTHWFSTMFGWYVFASWFVIGLSAITLVTIFLKEAGYLPLVNSNHLHDLGKFMFAFSIFWTYIWFSQFLLQWYANIPEESAYWVDRLMYNMGNYVPIFILNLLINFLFPFLFLMTRDAKRQKILLKVAAFGLLIGHWFDFYLMIAPGTLKDHGGMNLGFLFVELGTTIIYAGLFIFMIMFGLTKLPVVPKKHPMLEESIHLHV